MKQDEEVLLEHYNDINCDVYVMFKRNYEEISNKRYVVVWSNLIGTGCKYFLHMEQALDLVRELRNCNKNITSNTQKDLGNKILDILIAEGDKWGEMQQHWNAMKMQDLAKKYELRSNEALRLADLVNEFLNKEVK